jgi:hypothetical protein
MFKNEVRECLLLVNWFVRDNQMQTVLRMNILNCATSKQYSQQ